MEQSLSGLLCFLWTHGHLNSGGQNPDHGQLSEIL